MTRDEKPSFNPFPGLRPFQTGEEHLFFGREEQTASLLTRLREHRFLAVIGASGSGKSSLVRAGLIPALHGGAMTRVGSHWEVAVFRPGGDPITNLARSLLDAELYEAEDAEALHRLRATLTRSRFGLVEAVRQSGSIDEHTNLFVLVDQFEELFRFRERGTDHRDSAAAFVKLLLSANEESDVRIFVALTMRSDYLGDSARIPGLAQAINKGEFLIPRLTRDQKRDAIEKPVGVGRARIAPRLSQQMLNDVGDDPDQLPILQHALMRTWDAWVHDHAEDEPLDLRHYEATGGMALALSRHADEVHASLPDDAARERSERIFKTLTERASDNRGIRRPTRLAELEEIVGASREETLTVLDAFRAPRVTFLMPGAHYELGDRSVIDLSHESLMRVWTRLRSWVEEEAQSARVYRRLSETAALWRRGEAGLYRDPDLGIAAAWWEENAPSEAWATQYAGGFETAIEFLERSREAAAAEERAREEARQRELTQAKTLAETQSRAATTFKRFAASVAVLAALAIALAIWAFGLWDRTEELLVDSRHDQGRLWLERAQREFAEKDFLGAKLLAAEAIGFEGFGRAEASAEFRENHELLLRRESTEWDAARSLIELAPDDPLIWSSPSSRFVPGAHIHPVLSDDGSVIACHADGPVIKRFDTRSGEQLPPLKLTGHVQGLLYYSRQSVIIDGGVSVQVRDTATGEIRAYPEELKFNRRDRYGYLYSWVEKKLKIFSISSGEQIGETVELPNLESPVFAVALGQLYGAAVEAGVLYRIDFSGRGAGREVPMDREEIAGMFYSPDGRYLCIFPQASSMEDEVVSNRMLVYDGVTHALLYGESIPPVPGGHWPGAVPISETTVCLNSGTRGEGLVSLLFDLSTREFSTIYPGWLWAVPTGGSLAVFGNLYSLRILDLETRTYRGPGVEEACFGRIGGARFHPGGTYFVTFGAEGLKFRHSANGEVFARTEGIAVTDLTFSPDGKRFITCEPFRTVCRMWNAAPLETGSAPAVIDEIDGEASFTRFSPTGDRLAILDPGHPRDERGPAKAGTLRLINLESGEGGGSTLDLSLPEFDGRITFSPDGDELALLTGNSSPGGSARPPQSAGRVVLKRLDLLTRDWSPALELPEIVNDIAYSADGLWIGLATEHSARLLNRESGAFVVLPSASITGFDVVAFSPTGSLVAFGSSTSGWISLFDTVTAELNSRIPAHRDPVSSLEFSPDGRTLLSSSSRSSTVKLFEVSRRELKFALESADPEQLPFVHYLSDGRRVVRGQPPDGLRLVNVDTRAAETLHLPVPSPQPYGLVILRFDADRLRFLRASGSGEPGQSRLIQIHEARDGSLLGTLSHESPAGQGVFEPHGSRIATVAGRKLYLWSSETYEPLGSPTGVVEEGHELFAIDWSPDGRFIVCADELHVVVWNTEAAAPERTPLDIPGIDELRFQPEAGEFLAAMNQNGTLVLVDTGSWEVKRRLRGYRFPVGAYSRFVQIFDWHPRGSAFLFRNPVGGVEVREPLSGQTLARLDKRGAKVRFPWPIAGYLSAEFSPDGSRIAASAIPGDESRNDLIVTIWDPAVQMRKRVEDLPRFASYLDVYEFKKTEEMGPDSYMAQPEDASGEIVVSLIDTLYPSRSFAMRPVATDTHIAILRGNCSEEEKTRRLFDSYLEARNWNAAAILLRELPAGGATRERERFVNAVAANARALLEGSTDGAIPRVERLASHWLKLAEGFDADSESLREAWSLIEKRRSER